MKDTLLDFLVNQYGHRVDFQQPIVNRDNAAIQKQLDAVDNQLNQTKYFGLLWIIIGSGTLTINSAVLAAAIDPIRIFQLGIGILFLLYGIWNLNRLGELKKKKVILETILFINQH